MGSTCSLGEQQARWGPHMVTGNIWEGHCRAGAQAISRQACPGSGLVSGLNTEEK